MPTWLIIILSAAASYIVSLVVRILTAREKRILHEIDTRYSVGDPQFLRTMGGLLDSALVGGNKITTLLNGDEIFPAMLSAIGSARRTITFETFIYWTGDIGRRFADALIDRARAGVKVHVLLDWLGTRSMDVSILQSMQDAGISVDRYHPLRWYNLRRLNNRTHRKLLIVDGAIGFTGGVGIADEWTGNATDPKHWRDSHFQVEGPVVRQLQRAFMDNWLKTHTHVLHEEEYFPELHPCGTSLAQAVQTSPSEGSESARLMFLLSIACAERSVRIANSYFVPDNLSVQTLISAHQRGAKVQIIVPNRFNDVKVVRRASQSRYGMLLEAGIEIYEYQPTMYHCKVMIIDDLWSSVGSTNFDSRSFRLNDEANLNVYNAEFALRLVADFERDLAQSRRITLATWKKRPLRKKIVDFAAGLLRSQL